jgi:hypothetical protein
MVYIDGVYQNKTSYTVSGTTLDFGSSFPPPSGSKIECMTMNQLDVGAPVDDTISTAKIQALAVTEAKIAVNAVTSLKIAENAITARELATNAIATLFIADNSITSVKIAQNSILTKHIDDAQITTGHIIDANVTTAKIADNAVTAAKIGVDVLTDQVAGVTSSATAGSACLTIDSNEHATFANNLAVTGQQTTTGGALSAPSYSFIGDTDTGMSRPTTNAINFVTAGAERMRILANGQVLIGMTSAHSTDFKLSLYADASTAGVGFQNTSVGSTNYAALFRSNGASTIGSINVTNTATQFNTSSDYRLKENVRPIENGLDRLNNLNPVKFDWKDDGTSSEGFIAHEAQEVFPDAVTGEKDAEMMQGMDYGRVTPLLVKAIQEQQTIIDDLKARIATLEG